jgi:DNA-binding NarL/FixJ family response regulator
MARRAGETSDALFEGLTPPELEILRHLADGERKPHCPLSGHLRRTVKQHVKALLRKLGPPSRVATAVFAAYPGLGGKPRAPANRSRI